MKPKTSRNESKLCIKRHRDSSFGFNTNTHGLGAGPCKATRAAKSQFHDHHRLAKSQQRESKQNYYSILSAKLSRTRQNRRAERLSPKSKELITHFRIFHNTLDTCPISVRPWLIFFFWKTSWQITETESDFYITIYQISFSFFFFFLLTYPHTLINYLKNYKIMKAINFFFTLFSIFHKIFQLNLFFNL